jgi:hypothetical protein
MQVLGVSKGWVCCERNVVKFGCVGGEGKKLSGVSSWFQVESQRLEGGRTGQVRRLRIGVRFPPRPRGSRAAIIYLVDQDDSRGQRVVTRSPLGVCWSADRNSFKKKSIIGAKEAEGRRSAARQVELDGRSSKNIRTKFSKAQVIATK